MVSERFDRSDLFPPFLPSSSSSIPFDSSRTGDPCFVNSIPVHGDRALTFPLPSASFPFGSSHAPAYAPAPIFPFPIPTQINPNQPPRPPPAYHYLHDPTPVLPNPYYQAHASPPEATSRPTSTPPAIGAPGSTPTNTQPWVPSSPSPWLDPGRKTEEDDGVTQRYGGATYPIEQSGGACYPATPDSTCQGRDHAKGNITSSANLSSSKAVQVRTFLAYDGDDHVSPTTATPGLLGTASTVSVHSTIAQNPSTPPASNYESTCRQPWDYQQGASSLSDAHKVFEPMPSLQGRVLTVKIHHKVCPISVETLRKTFWSCGVVEKMIYTAHVHSPHVFIQYQNDQMASQAIWVLQGKCIPGTYCQLDIQLAQGSDLHTFQDYSYEMNFQSDTMDHKTPTIDRRMDILNMLAQVQAKLNTISENLSRDLKRMESRESKQSAATQEAGMAPVMCSKTNNTVSSESLLVPNQQLPMNVQDASHVFKETPVYDIHEEDVTAGRRCLYPSVDTIAAVAEEIEVKVDSDKPIISPERPTVRTVGAFSLTNEKSICDLEKMNAGENLFFATQDKEQLIQYFSIVAAFRNVPDVYVTRTCQEESQGDAKLFREKYVCQIVTGLSILLFPWDPGARKFPVLFITVAQVRKLMCTDVFKSELTCSSEIQKLLNSWVNLKKMIPWPAWKLQLSTPLKLFMQSLCANTAAQMTKQRHHLEFLVMDQMLQNLNEFRDGQLAYISQGNSIHSPEWVRPIITVFSCWLPSLEMAKLQWDPRITLSSEMYTLLEILSGGCKIVQPKHFWAYLLLQYHSWCPTPNASFQAQDPCLPIVLDCLHSEPFKQLDCYSNIFSSTAMYMSTATHVHRRSVLSFGKIAQAEKDAAAMYHVLKIQLPMSTTSHIWDPGIESSLFLYKGLHIRMIQQVDYSVIHACDLVFALLPPTQIAACYPSNIKQGIQENYNAKHLMLSSQDYVNSQEIDIIFMTFRPP